MSFFNYLHGALGLEMLLGKCDRICKTVNNKYIFFLLTHEIVNPVKNIKFIT